MGRRWIVKFDVGSPAERPDEAAQLAETGSEKTEVNVSEWGLTLGTRTPSPLGREERQDYA
jgi:hypothetical protein